MSFQIDLNPFEDAYAYFIREVRDSIQRTYEQEAGNGLTQKELAETLGVDQAVISRRLNGPGNITLRTLCDIFTAMGRRPLANFVVPTNPPVRTDRISIYDTPGPDKSTRQVNNKVVEINFFDPKKSAA